jgi:DNA-binding CsgD family transcriptional regulator
MLGVSAAQCGGSGRVRNEQQHILKAIEHIYSWAEEGDALRATIASSADLLGADVACIFQLSLNTAEHTLIGSSVTHLDESLLLASASMQGNWLGYCRGWDEDNIYDGERLQTEDDFLDSAFYKNFMQPLGLRYGLAGVVKREPASCIVLSCYRSNKSSPFGPRERELMQILLPHWRRTVQLRNKLDHVGRHSRAADRILDHAPFSIMMVDSTGRILYRNFMSQLNFQDRDGMSVGNNRIGFSDSSAKKQFINLLGEAGKLRELGETYKPVLMSVDRPSGRKPFQLMVLPVQESSEAGLATGPTFGVFIYDPTVNLPVDVDSLRNLEGLTTAEARLCQSLYVTKNLQVSADHLHISLSTAKTHLLNTFRKLKINSQPELMQYLAHMPKIASDNWH